MIYSILGICLIFWSPASGLYENNTTCACGWKNAHNLDRSEPIYGGSGAQAGEWPYFVHLQIKKDKNRYRCGGTIITKRHVLTAAHCLSIVIAPESIKVYYNKLKEFSDEGESYVKYVQKLYVHEENKPLYNDIGLILIIGEFSFNQRVGPVCVGMDRVPDGESVIALGMGDTGKSLANKTNELQMVKLVTKNAEKCFYLLNKRYPNNTVNATETLCVNMIDKSVCPGDSGGPLLWYDIQIQRYFLVGITSFGHNDVPKVRCPFIINAFTDVSFYKNWIIEKIKRKRKKAKI